LFYTLWLSSKCGEDINAENGFCGNTALLVIAESGHEKVLKLLLDAERNIYAGGEINCDTVLQAAAKRGYEKAVKLLMKGKGRKAALRIEA
jgi:ankyrin repeat protein